MNENERSSDVSELPDNSRVKPRIGDEFGEKKCVFSVCFSQCYETPFDSIDPVRIQSSFYLPESLESLKNRLFFSQSGKPSVSFLSRPDNRLAPALDGVVIGKFKL
jgi:hypothetical protein